MSRATPVFCPVKVKFSLDQGMKAQRGSRGIALSIYLSIYLSITDLRSIGPPFGGFLVVCIGAQVLLNPDVTARAI
jgi:hypothetical protein